MNNGHNSIELAKHFREEFNEKFRDAQVSNQESFLISVKEFDLHLTLLDSYPGEVDTGIPKEKTAEWHRHINFRNQIRKNINNAARVGSHIGEDGSGYPPFEIRVNYVDGPKYKRGPKEGKPRKRKDKVHYVIRLLSATVRILHSEVAETLHRYATNKVKYLSTMNDYIKDHLRELPPELRLAHKLRGKRTEKTISLAAQIIADNIKETADEYREVVALLGPLHSPPVGLDQLPPAEVKEDDDD